jgi:hypothetical protein
MRMKTCLMSASVLLLGVCLGFAQGPQFDAPEFRGPILSGPDSFQDGTPIPGIGNAPSPDASFSNPGFPGPGGPVILPQVDGVPVPLASCDCQFYDRVCYKDKKKIAPCAQTMVVSVIDPCSRKYDCEKRCVQVKICVPPCDCPKVKVTRNGRHTRYDFGKYAVDIFSNRNGSIVVDYDA